VPDVRRRSAVDPAHRDLVRLAEGWLRNACGCGVVLRDPFWACVETGERPDAIGWRGAVSILVECKTSRADFLVDRKKPFRVRTELGMGDWRFYLCPPQIIQTEDLPLGHGLLWAEGRTVHQVHGVPLGNTRWVSDRPFLGNKAAESAMLLSALRRCQKPRNR